MATDANALYDRACILISTIFALPESERTERLEKECAADAALRAEVRWMLDALRSPHDSTFLEQALGSSALMPDDQLHVPAPRDYQIIKPLGEGGMGTVYLAKRRGGEYEQLVALKLLNMTGLAQPIVLARFVSERKILAELNHTNIAHLVDGGTLPDGRPFLAMEYVDGVSIDRFCLAGDLTVPARLELFLKVCGAVQFAHQHLIVHRDIKPDNILVTSAGEPKLLDFGIARLLDPASALSAMRTSTGIRMMTLAYASPEQISGKPVSVASDIFSLGVVLYELLTSHRPWPDNDSVVDLAKLISERDPPPPSTNVTTQSKISAGTLHRPRDKRISTDLDAIVLKALRKEPEQRYATAQDFADDIRNFLETRPVAARRGHAAYRIGKYLRRNRLVFSGIALVLVLLIAFGVDRQVQLGRTRVERSKAEQINDFMLDIFAASQPEQSRGATITARELLVRGAERARNGLTGQPAVRASMLQAIGSALRTLGLASDALPLLEETLILRREAGDASAIAETLIALSDTNLRMSQLDKAQQNADAAVQALESTNNASGRIYAMALAYAGITSAKRGQPIADSIAQFKAAQSVIGKSETRPFDKERIDYFYANTLRVRGQTKEANEIAVAALQDPSLKSDPTHPLAVQFRRMRVSYLMGQGEFKEASDLLVEILNSERTIYGPTHPAIADDLLFLGALKIKQEDYVAAEDVLRQSLAIIGSNAANDNEDMHIRALNNLAVALKLQDKFSEASAMQDDIARRAEKRFGQKSEMYAGALQEKASIALLQKHYVEAEPLFLSAISANSALSLDLWDDMADLQSDLGRTYLGLQEPSKAEISLKAAVAIREKHVGRENIATLHILPDLAASLAQLGRNEEAGNLFRESLGPIIEKDGQCGEYAVHARELWNAAYAQSKQLAPPPEASQNCEHR